MFTNTNTCSFYASGSRNITWAGRRHPASVHLPISRVVVVVV